MNSDSLLNAVHIVLGAALFCLGVSFAFKFYQAAMSGKVEYWSGLQHFGFIFLPFTVFVTPMLCHLPYNPKNSLIATRQALWVHLVFAPVFFVSALMCMTSGADLIGLGIGKGGGASSGLNYVLTLGQSNVAPCIIYSPPQNNGYFDIGSYRFPFAKKAGKRILRTLCTTIPYKSEDSYNPYERNGEQVNQYTRTGIEWLDENDEDILPEPNKQAAAATTGKK